MIIRNEDKFRTRNQSKRNYIENAIIRPDIIAMIAHARSQLAFPGGNQPSSPLRSTMYVDLLTWEATNTPTATTMTTNWEKHWKEYDETTLFSEKEVLHSRKILEVDQWAG